MTAWALKGFGGLIPRTDARLLGDNMAEQAVNCDLASGAIKGLPIPELLEDLSSTIGAVNRAYRLPAPPGTAGPDAWLPLPSPYSSVVRSPLANDTNHRIYWTNPGDAAPHWNTYAGIIAGTPAFDLGTVAPPAAALTVTTTGGTTSVPQEARSYVYTFVNSFGEETAPSPPSTVVDGPPDATWNVNGFNTSAPTNPLGFNYPPIVSVNIYRTLVSATQGTQFFFVANYPFPLGSSTYHDTLPSTTVVNQNTLVSSQWANPPSGLDGLIAMPGGMLLGFTANTVHFCEPDHPHAWPAQYDQSLQYDILSLAVWQQSVVALTKGFPFTGSGTTPGAFVFVEVRVPEPCISRGSVITDLLAVYYASQNGLIMINYFGMQNQTLTIIDKNEWLVQFDPANIIACRHRAQYLAVDPTQGKGFIIDYSEGRLGFMPLSTFQDVTCVWNDEYTGDAYICADKKIYRWDSPNTGPLTFRWRSKRFFTPAAINLGAAQVSVDASVLTAALGTQTLSNGDATLTLPAGAVCVFNCYAGPSQKLIKSRVLKRPESIFRLPSGFKATEWQFEVVSCVPVRMIQVASTMHELKNV